MRRRGRMFLMVLMALCCLHTHADILPEKTTVVTSVSAQGTVARQPGSMQLHTNEVAILLEHLQNQHVYLKHLENVRDAVERELSILQLMDECGRFDSTCTGRGIIRKSISGKPVTDKPGNAGLAPPQQTVSPPSPAQPSPSPVELPKVVAIYGGTASLFYKRRYLEVRRGDRLGPFRVMAVSLDGIKVDGPQGALSLLARWHTPEAVTESLAGSRRFSRF